MSARLSLDGMAAAGRARRATFATLALAAAAGCTPDVPRDPVPEEMIYDLQSRPPNVPQPTVLVMNRTTGRIDFSQAGVILPTDCSMAQTPPPGATPMPQAECEFDHYLQRLDGFPTVTPATAPASAALDPTTLTGANVVVVNAATGAVVPDAKVSFDTTSGHLVVRPARSWSIGATYWIGVRGYGNGVRAVGGKEVVGSSTHALLKQTMSLTCMAVPPDPIAATCPGLQLLSQSYPSAVAMQLLFQLEPARQVYAAGGGFELMAAAGLPREELAVLWGFPVHSFSVAELDPPAGLVPAVVAPNEIHVAVQGTVDPASVKATVFMGDIGTVVLMDLSALAAMDLPKGIPPAEASYVAGDIVIRTAAPLVAGHQYGIFMTNGLTDATGRPLVPPPISVLLSLQGTLVDAATGHSTISTVADADAVQLEAGRMQLAALFDNTVLKGVTGVGRDNLVYAFAFAVGGTP
ncbi:MAG TPA: hypothetical protein VIU64_16970 [Polyangia bacterium]